MHANDIALRELIISQCDTKCDLKMASHALLFRAKQLPKGEVRKFFREVMEVLHMCRTKEQVVVVGSLHQSDITQWHPTVAAQ